MRELYIDGALMTSREQAHNVLKETLELPEYYGNNLDAPHDCLTDICQPTTIVLSNADTLSENLGSYGDILIHVLADAADENENVTVTINK